MRTPAQFKNNAVRTRKADELEKKIDNAIDGAVLFGHAAVTVGCAGFPPDIVDQVMADYRRAGWKVERVADIRDGDFIQLEPK